MDCYSNGVMQPFNQLGWWQWMYYLSPFTYLIEGLLGQGTFFLELRSIYQFP